MTRSSDCVVCDGTGWVRAEDAERIVREDDFTVDPCWACQEEDDEAPTYCSHCERPEVVVVIDTECALCRLCAQDAGLGIAEAA